MAAYRCSNAHRTPSSRHHSREGGNDDLTAQGPYIDT